MSKTKRPTKPKLSFKRTATGMLSHMGSKILQDKFFNAIYTRNIPEMEVCLERGANPNKMNDEYGMAPLHLLAERNDYELGYRLLHCPTIDPYIKSTHGTTILHIACRHICKNFLSMLLRYGLDPNVTNRFGETPLHVAIKANDYGIVLKLLQNRVHVNVLDCFENTPLSLSILDTGNIKIAKALCAYGADMSLESQRNLHIFFETVLKCHRITQIDFILLLLENEVNINMQEPSTGRICLHFVAITGFLELAMVLVQKGAEINAFDKQGRSPSRVAVEHGNFFLADYFRKGYRPPNVLGTLPLMYLWCNKLKTRLVEKKQISDKELQSKSK